MSVTVLEKKYKEPDRPYSQLELKSMRENNRFSLYIGKVRAHHLKCGHFYLTKYNGKKEKEIIQNGNNPDTGNCSVCWKLGKTPKHLYKSAKSLVGYYNSNFYEEPKFLTYDMVTGELDFYTWLYEEFT